MGTRILREKGEVVESRGGCGLGELERLCLRKIQDGRTLIFVPLSINFDF